MRIRIFPFFLFFDWFYICQSCRILYFLYEFSFHELANLSFYLETKSGCIPLDPCFMAICLVQEIDDACISPSQGHAFLYMSIQKRPYLLRNLI